MSNRRQPARQARLNPARNATNARTLGGGTFGAQQEPPKPDIAPGFFPGIMHFTDSITALPKEMVRHYTMLKEVDAKIYHPEETLKKLVGESFKRPPPQPTTIPGLDASQYTTKHRHGVGETVSDPTDPDNLDARFDRQHRELQLQLRVVANSMLVTLDEKNHVLGNATDHLEKLLARCESSWDTIEEEISEVTRIGNLEHWAYTNNAPTEKKASAHEARPRREAATNNLAALANTADLEGRFDGRTVLGSRKHRLPQGDSDFDEPRAAKRNVTGKGKKPEITSAPSLAGLGITNGTANKKRKIEKTAPATGGHAMDRSASSLYGNSMRGAGSPRETPALEASKKRNRNTGGALAAAVQGRKRAGTANSAVNSPNLASSPIAGSFNAAPRVANSPALGAAMQRTSSTRARQNSAHTSQPARPPSTTIKEANGISHKPTVEPTSAPKNVDSKNGKSEDAGNNDTSTRSSGRSSDRGSLKREESTNSRPRPPSITTSARNNNGKASKTGTPVAASFPETTRPRSGRNASMASLPAEPPPKRSHKKGGGIGAQAAAAAKAAAEAAKAAAGDDNNSDAGEEEEPADGEPLYCYCQKVSYGEMIGCDNDNCKREWFHLGCVGLDKVPGKTDRWFCIDCKPLFEGTAGSKRR